MEEKLKNILITINKEHQKKISDQIYGIFLLGFILGVIFSYTGILGFFAGFCCGIIIRNRFYKQTNEFIEKSYFLCSLIITNVKNKLETKS